MADRAPKSKGKAPAGKGKQVTAKKGGEDEREETLQAVVRKIKHVQSICPTARLLMVSQVLADSFETRFNPFALEKPRVCLHMLLISQLHKDDTD